MDIKTAKETLLKMQDKASAYEHALGLLSFDGQTTAPSKTASNRAHAIEILSGEIYKLTTGEETVQAIKFLNEHREELSENELRMVDILSKSLKYMQSIPMEEYLAYERLTVEAGEAWREAKANNDFNHFAPFLEKIYETVKKFAAYVSPEMDPYDFWLNEFEEGLTQEFCEEFFGQVKSRIVPLVKSVTEKKQVDDSCLKGTFDEIKQEKFARYLMDVIGLDPEHVGLATTEHPFTTSLGSHLDERITTHYYEENVAYSMYSVVHEGGHALYDTGSDDSLAYSVLDGGVSMAIHESQSRFYENIIGRSKPFIELIFPKMKEIFSEELKDATADEIYRAVNKVEPSFIRTEADEVTYSLHVLVRYELEKKLFRNEIEVRDLPEEWKKLYKEYLGVDVPDDTRGVLQDVHWSDGLIGYFPSYAIGSAYGAQFLKKMKEDIDVDACVAKGDFASINKWNREHIWKYGSSKTPKEILNIALGGEPFSFDYYVEYLQKKIESVYE